MFCKKCGNQINETQAFCEYCGEKVESMYEGSFIRPMGYKEYFRINAVKKVKTTNIIATVLYFSHILLWTISLWDNLWYYLSVISVMMFTMIVVGVTMGVLMLTVKKWIFPLVSSCCLMLDIGWIGMGWITIGVSWINIWLGIVVLIFIIMDVVYLYMFQMEYKRYCETIR